MQREERDVMVSPPGSDHHMTCRTVMKKAEAMGNFFCFFAFSVRCVCLFGLCVCVPLALEMSEGCCRHLRRESWLLYCGGPGRGILVTPASRLSECRLEE